MEDFTRLKVVRKRVSAPSTLACSSSNVLWYRWTLPEPPSLPARQSASLWDPTSATTPTMTMDAASALVLMWQHGILPWRCSVSLLAMSFPTVKKSGVRARRTS